HVEQIAAAVPSMADADADYLNKQVAGVLHEMRRELEWMNVAERAVELSPYPLHSSGVVVAGPAISECPARDDMPVAQLAQEKVAELAMACEREDLPAWIASLASYAGVWSEPSFAIVCK